MKFLFILFSLSFSALSADLDLHLNDLEALVKQNLSELKAAQIRITQSRLGRDVQMADFSFRADITSSYSLLTSSQDNFSFGYSPNSDERFSNALQISHYLYGFGRKKWIEAEASSNIDFARTQEKILTRNLVFKARLNFWSTLFAKASGDIAQQRLKLRLEEETDTKSLYEAGTLNRVDLLQSQVNALQSRNLLRQSTSRIQQNLRDLAASIGNQSDLIKTKGDLLKAKDLAKLFTELKNQLHSSYEISSLQINSAQSTSRIKQLDSFNKPELVGYGSVGTEGFSSHEHDDGWQVGVSLNWNLFDSRKRHNRQLIEHANIQANSHSIQAEVRERRRIYQGLHDEWTGLMDQLDNQALALMLAEENYTIARDQFRAGLLTLTQVSDVNLQFFENKFRLISLFYQSQIIKENLNFLLHQ